MKYCGNCTETKPFSEFGKNSRRKDGLQSQCNFCRSEHRKKVREQTAEYKREWHERNPDYNLQYYAENRDSISSQKKEYRSRNSVREARRVEKHKRRTHYSGGTAPSNSLSILLDFYGRKCMHPECIEIEGLQLDHVVPISLGGEHTLENLQILCGTHNAKKGNRSCADYRQGRIISTI